MAISRERRFPIEFAEAFPQGLVLMGEVAPDTEYQSREDRAAGRPVRQRVDELTGMRQWKATVKDPDERNAKRALFEITFLADVQPAPSTAEVLPGVRPIELDAMTAEPPVAGKHDGGGSARQPHPQVARPARDLAVEGDGAWWS